MQNKKEYIIFFASIIITILVAIIPMRLSPFWNGDIPMHRNQYEEITKAFLKGKLSFDYEVNPELLKLDNPYDPESRIKASVDYKWDHALYNGKYYMYFGVAPVIFTFMPYKIITGHDLTTYHATQLYVSLYIIGVFLLFNFIKKTFFAKESSYLTILASAIFSLLSIWICITQPALYCTAISAGLCAAIFAIYFFIKAFYADFSFNRRLIYLVIGAFCGALIFACRPPLGIINILLPVLLISYIKNNHLSKKEMFKLLWIMIPYVVVAILLMTYNYLRFDNPFEFGQAYQLTVADQHHYSSLFGNLDILKTIKDLFINFFYAAPFTKTFPYIGINGIFISFPILLYPYLFMFIKDYRDHLKKNNIYIWYLVLLFLPFMISIIDSIFSPVATYRYYLDLYYIMIITAFISLLVLKKLVNNKFITYIIFISLLITLLSIILLIFVPNDNNFASYYFGLLPKIESIISFWR